MPDSSPRHFDLPDLIDYVRNAGEPGRLAAIRHHLEVERCEQCRRSAQLLADAWGAARELAKVEVPLASVARAQAIFHSRPAAAPAWWKNLPAVAAEWIGGPAGEPALAGFRSTAAVHGQRVFALGSLQIRLLLERDPNGGRMLVGALSDLSNPATLYAGVPVLVISGKSAVSEARTSRFGEFQLEVPPARRGLRLAIVLENERIEIEIED